MQKKKIKMMKMKVNTFCGKKIFITFFNKDIIVMNNLINI